MEPAPARRRRRRIECAQRHAGCRARATSHAGTATPCRPAQLVGVAHCCWPPPTQGWRHSSPCGRPLAVAAQVSKTSAGTGKMSETLSAPYEVGSSVAGSPAMRLENRRNPAVGDDPGHNRVHGFVKHINHLLLNRPRPRLAHKLRSHSRLSGRRLGASRCAKRSPAVLARPSLTTLLAGRPRKAPVLQCITWFHTAGWSSSAGWRPSSVSSARAGTKESGRFVTACSIFSPAVITATAGQPSGAAIGGFAWYKRTTASARASSPEPAPR